MLTLHTHQYAANRSPEATWQGCIVTGSVFGGCPRSIELQPNQALGLLDSKATRLFTPEALP
jgi:hypothetical protein